MARYSPTTALLIVDVQNDFADPAGGLPVPGGAAVVPAINADRACPDGRRAHLYTQDWHPSHTPHFAQDGGLWPVHCVRDTWGAALHPQLLVEGPVVRKGANGEDGYSGFTMRDPASGQTVPTELAALLRAAGIERVVVCGLATDYCVKATAIDARSLGYATAVVVDAIRAVDVHAGDGDKAIIAMTEAGVLAVESSPV